LADLAALQEILGVSFEDSSLLGQALIHSSYINENPDLAPTSNERLEFLGDAVLGLIIAEKLYHDLPSQEPLDLEITSIWERVRRQVVDGTSRLT